MQVLVIGSGAREHALVSKLQKSKRVNRVLASPGNAGIARIAEVLSPDEWSGSEVERFATMAEDYEIDLTVVGPEALLVAGIVDEFQRRNLRIFGPTAEAARLEGSKVWAKVLMESVRIPTAQWQSFTDPEQARDYAKSLRWKCVVKADGLAQGKGSYVCRYKSQVESAIKDLLVEHKFTTSTILIEELLDGQEVSVFAISDGRTVLPFGAAQDHKRLRDHDQGPNTGGMGAYSPVEHMKVAQDFAVSFFQPLVTELAGRGTPYVGVLYAGAIVTDQGPRILEFNCRFGDPETQVLLAILDEDLGEILWKATEGQLHTVPTLSWKKQEALCVVIAGGEYPDSSDFGKVIHGVPEAEKVEGVSIFHAGTLEDPESHQLITNGGRILSVTGLGSDLREAQGRAYDAVAKIDFPGRFYRKDIGTNATGAVWERHWVKPLGWGQQNLVDSVEVIGKIANDLESFSLVEGRSVDERRQLSDLREGLYEVILLLNKTSSGAATEAAETPIPQLSRLSAEFDELLERMQEPGVAEGVDAVFRRSNRKPAESAQNK